MDIKVGDMLYWARIRPNTEEFDVIDLKVVTKYKDCFVCTEESMGQRHMFGYGEYNKKIFSNRFEALQVALEAEEGSKEVIG